MLTEVIEEDLIVIDNKPNESKSNKDEQRVSTSKSGFTDKDFVLVFKNGDGRYSSPRKIPRNIALEIAKDLASNSDAAEKYGINRSVAKFILAKARRKGLISSSDKAVDKADDNFDLVDIATDSIEKSDAFASAETSAPSASSKIAIERHPKYFPKIDAYAKPNLATETIEVIAFVLSGVDPDQVQDPRIVQRTLTLRQLIQLSAARVSPGLLMQDDHWYVLAHLHSIDRDAFKLAWEEAQSQASGQANTDVVKLMTKLDKFKIDAAANCLDDAANKSFFLDVQDKSIELLSRIFRRIRRKIESVHENPVPEPPKKSWLNSLIRPKATDQPHASPIQTEVTNLVTEYLKQSIKIGRILRSDVLKMRQ